MKGTRMSISIPLARATTRTKRSLRDGEKKWGLIFVAPAMMHFLLFTSLPVFAVLFLSFTNYSILDAPKFNGIDNYIRVLKDDVFWTSVGNTLLYAFTTVPATVILSLAVAVMLNQSFIGRALYRVAFYVPHVTSAAAISMVWLFLYNAQFGLVNFFLEKIGLEGRAWLERPETAMWAIIVISIWRGIGGNMVIFIAGLQGIPALLYEAAAIDGAGRWKTFWNITLPMLTPTTFFVLVTSFIGSFQVYEQVYMMTNGGPGYATTTIVHQIYQQAFHHYKLGYASAVSVFLFIFILAITLINNKILKSDIEYN